VKIYLVTYDLHVRGQNYTDLLAKIKESAMWARLSESSYAMGTEKTPQQLFDYLKPGLDSNDQLYIVTITKPYIGVGTEEVNSWLENNLPSNHHW
jgi:hypothetical protein